MKELFGGRPEVFTTIYALYKSEQKAGDAKEKLNKSGIPSTAMFIDQNPSKTHWSLRVKTTSAHKANTVSQLLEDKTNPIVIDWV